MMSQRFILRRTVLYRAWKRLAKEHPEEFVKYVNEECDKLAEKKGEEVIRENQEASDRE